MDAHFIVRMHEKLVAIYDGIQGWRKMEDVLVWWIWWLVFDEEDRRCSGMMGGCF